MKKIKEIYKEYKIMPILAVHQMRVTAVAMQVCDSLDLEVEKDNIIKACLLHDMGNIIKFNLNYFPELNQPEGIEYWKKIQDEFIEKYGKNEHKATILIGEELNVSHRILELMNCVDSSMVEILAMGNDFNKKICMYADGRVTPHGVVSIEERSREAKERYKDHPYIFDEESRLHFNKSLDLIENQIFSHSNIKPENINDESIKKYLEKLEDFSM